MKKTLAFLFIIVIVAVGCSSNSEKKGSTTTTTEKAQAQGNVKFKECGALKCAKISVPMDYKKPKGRKIQIALKKIPAAVAAKRIGVLLVNPGGPGASGNDFVSENARFLFSQEILDSFDIVGWDPRGVGESTKVECSDDLDFLFDGVDYTPDSKTEEKKLLEENKLIGEKCADVDAELLPFLDSESAVQDMDSIRIALKEDKINYLGFSYGTALGQIYATKFPTDFRTMVVDGVLDLSLTGEQVSTEQIVGFEDALNNFFEFCKDNSCKYANGKDPKSGFISIMNQIDSSPIPSINDPEFILGPAQLDIGAAYFLYGGEVGWQSLDSALKAIELGNPTQMLSGFSSYVGRGGDGTYDGSYVSFLSIGCADGSLGTPDELLTKAEQIKSKAPIFGESGFLLGLPCSFWPNVKLAKTFTTNTKTAAPIVVIGTTGDPATPVKWARSAAKQLENSVYVERRGEGHTAYGQGNECIDDLVETYLLTGKAPNSKVC